MCHIASISSSNQKTYLTNLQGNKVSYSYQEALYQIACFRLTAQYRIPANPTNFQWVIEPGV